MATSLGALKAWEGSLQGVAWQREGARQGESEDRRLRRTLQRPGFARCFVIGDCNFQTQCLHTRRDKLYGGQLRHRSTGRAQKIRSSRLKTTVASAFLQHEHKKPQTQQPSQPQRFLQHFKALLALTPQRKSIVLLNVLAFIDGATAVVIKATELNTGSEEAPAAGTSLMFFVRVMVGLLAFAPALTHRFNTEAAAAASSSAELLTSPLSSAPALSPGSATGGLGLPMVETPQNVVGAVANSRGVAGTLKEVREETAGAWETLYWPGMLSGVFMFLGDAGQALGLETSTADHAAVLLTGSVILVPFLEAFSGRKIGAPVWLSALLATAGMLLLEQGSDIATTVSEVPWHYAPTHILQSIPIGDCWCLTSSIAFALYMVLSEEQCVRTDPLKLAAVQLATTVVLSALWEAWDLHHNGGGAGGALLLRHLAAMPWAAVLFVGIIGTGLASWMELAALQTVNSTTATLVYTTGPLWSAILAYFALGETMDAVSCGGAALILLASIGTQVFAPPKTLRTGRALAHPLGTTVETSKDSQSEAGRVAVRNEEQPVTSTPVDSFVELVHKVAETRSSRWAPNLKLLPIRAIVRGRGSSAGKK
ncbi:hypothetical protein KFL_006050010 [Klebsormidium nitens]|uniref:EamA domain-containing protein n=1 Tax=Klebsormidium nitens TaxID=105231 RepID=A0A1Y1IPR8_KLENI|nr:hypothetical protein KFL_006050010 [Klebsormidium nitens]|eukprot:GAQ90138.1 hypothetical protein KFL_006050010 [Klebsormidium nitens]